MRDLFATRECTSCRTEVVVNPNMLLTAAARHAREAGHPVASWRAPRRSMPWSVAVRLACFVAVPAGALALVILAGGMVAFGGIVVLVAAALCCFVSTGSAARETTRINMPAYHCFTDPYGRMRVHRHIDA